MLCERLSSRLGDELRRHLESAVWPVGRLVASERALSNAVATAEGSQAESPGRASDSRMAGATGMPLSSFASGHGLVKRFARVRPVLLARGAAARRWPLFPLSRNTSISGGQPASPSTSTAAPLTPPLPIYALSLRCADAQKGHRRPSAYTFDMFCFVNGCFLARPPPVSSTSFPKNRCASYPANAGVPRRIHLGCG